MGLLLNNLSNFYFTTVSSSDLSSVEEIQFLRKYVWETSGFMRCGEFVDFWQDKYDFCNHSMHWVVRTQDGMLIASARASIHDNLVEFPDSKDFLHLGLSLKKPIGTMNRLVVRKEFSGLGIAGRLDSIRLRHLMKLNVSAILIQAPSWREESFLSYGFRSIGEAAYDMRFSVPFRAYLLEL